MIEVHIDDRFERNGLDVHIFEKVGGGRLRIYGPDPTQPNNKVIDAGVGVSMVDQGTPFHIPREAAGPLWAALGKLLGSVENPEMLRKDFVHEQTRRDTLENAIIDLAKASVR
jgi:hypothetical protein